MTDKFCITFLVLTFGYFALLGECANTDDIKCYKCENDKECMRSAEKGVFETVTCSKKDSVCFTRRTERLIIRGCKKVNEKFDESNGKLLFEDTCNTELCNQQEMYECYACNEDNCKDPMDKTKAGKEYCLSGYKGCYTMRKKQKTFRGCAKNEESLRNLTLGGELQGPCKKNLCNDAGKPKDPLTCYYCKDKGVCNDPKQDATGTHICKDARTCYTRKLAQYTERGCTDKDVAQDLLEDKHSILGDTCSKSLCNTEKTYNCYSCTDKENCAFLDKPEKLEQVVCADRDQGCFTITKLDGNTIRGCAVKETNLTSLAEAGVLKDNCKTNLCNSYKKPKGAYTCNKCDDKKTCDKPDDKNPFEKELCEIGHEGCYTIVKDESTLRGCAHTKEKLDQIKGNGTLLEPCKQAGCNNQTIYECHQCVGVGQCLYPNVTEEAKFEKCIAGSHVGCITLEEKDKITRKCAKNNSEVEEYKKRGNLTVPCTQDRCNKEKAALYNGSGMISPIFISVILPVIGVLFVRV